MVVVVWSWARVPGWGCDVAVAPALAWRGGAFEWIPVRINTTMSTVTAAIAAAGPARRRGRVLMDSMTLSWAPLMKVGWTTSGPASSKVTGSEGFATGGGGTGGTGVDPGSVSRTVDVPETLKALAGKTPWSLPFGGPAEGRWACISSSVCSWR